MIVFSQLIKARFQQVATDLTESVSGLFWQNTDDKKLKFHDGSEIREVVDTNSVQELTNKTLSPDSITQDADNRFVSDTEKSIWNAKQAFIEPSLVNEYYRGDKTFQTLDKIAVGLTNVDNTSDADKNAATATLLGKTLITPIIGVTIHPTETTPSSPASGQVKTYVKEDGKLYVLNSSGVEKAMGSGSGGGSSLTWEKIGDLPPQDMSQDGIRLAAFSPEDEQDIYLTVNVPSEFTPGTQIKLLGGAFFCDADNSGNVQFRAMTTLLRVGVSTLGSLTNTHQSTNSSILVTPSLLVSIGEIDLTDGLGRINGIQVLGGDKLRVRLLRVITGGFVNANDYAKLMINNFEIKFAN